MKRLDRLRKTYRKAKYLFLLEGNKEWDEYCDKKFIEVTNKLHLILEITTYVIAIIVFAKIVYDSCV